MKENPKDIIADPINQPETISTKIIDPEFIPESQKDIDPKFRIPRPRRIRNYNLL